MLPGPTAVRPWPLNLHSPQIPSVAIEPGCNSTMNSRVLTCKFEDMIFLGRKYIIINIIKIIAKKETQDNFLMSYLLEWQGRWYEHIHSLIRLHHLLLKARSSVGQTCNQETVSFDFLAVVPSG